MKRNPHNIAFIAGVRARLHRMRIIMGRYDGWQKAPKKRPLPKVKEKK